MRCNEVCVITSLGKDSSSGRIQLALLKRLARFYEISKLGSITGYCRSLFCNRTWKLGFSADKNWIRPLDSSYIMAKKREFYNAGRFEAEVRTGEVKMPNLMGSLHKNPRERLDEGRRWKERRSVKRNTAGIERTNIVHGALILVIPVGRGGC